MRKQSGLNRYKMKKILWHFCVDIDATKTSKLLRIDRKIINDHFTRFREGIFKHQMYLSSIAPETIPTNKIKGFPSFTKRRLAKFHGVKINLELHLKESEWRFRKTEEQLLSELLKILKKM
jgi:transposase-like protein